jgi:hypothetical protein
MLVPIFLLAVFALTQGERSLPQIPSFGDGVDQSFVDDKANRLRGRIGDFITLGRGEKFLPSHESDDKRRSQTGRATNLVVNGGFETGDFTGWT